MQASAEVTLDEDEFLRLKETFELLEGVCRSHILELKGKLCLDDIACSGN